MKESHELLMVIDTTEETDEEPPAIMKSGSMLERQESVLLSLLAASTRSQSAPDLTPAIELYKARKVEPILESDAEAVQREKLQRMYIKRRQIINEILHTERIYVRNMEAAIKVSIPLQQLCWSRSDDHFFVSSASSIWSLSRSSPLNPYRVSYRLRRSGGTSCFAC